MFSVAVVYSPWLVAKLNATSNTKRENWDCKKRTTSILYVENISDISLIFYVPLFSLFLCLQTWKCVWLWEERRLRYRDIKTDSRGLEKGKKNRFLASIDFDASIKIGAVGPIVSKVLISSFSFFLLIEQIQQLFRKMMMMMIIELGLWQIFYFDAIKIWKWEVTWVQNRSKLTVWMS